MRNQNHEMETQETEKNSYLKMMDQLQKAAIVRRKDGEI